MAQRRLKETGLYQKDVDGLTGRNTHDALIEFQRRNNLPLTARLDQATWQKFGLDATTPEEMREEGKKCKKRQLQVPKGKTPPDDDPPGWFRTNVWNRLIRKR